VKFGLHYLMSCADTQSPIQRYRDTVEQAVRGEALGFESVWPVEQHFNRNFSILPAPALLLAAIAERTTTLRLGTAIVQVALDHPLRIAEQIATLDVLSGGRVEFGVGRGTNPFHFAGFGVPMAESRDRFVEGLDYICAAWTRERFSFDGRFFQADDISLVPKPFQRPHPPIRVAANSAETAVWAAREGYPIFVASNINPFPRLRELVPMYRDARRAAGHSTTQDDLTILMPLFVGASGREIEHAVKPSINQYVDFVSAAAEPMLRKSSSDVERHKLQAILAQMRSLSYEQMNDMMAIFDTPEACVERLKQIEEEFNPGRIICWFNFGGMVPHDRVMRSMELFSSKVLPRF